MADVPLDPEPVIGWRAWRLQRRRDGLRLVSLTRDDAWPAGEAMEARCERVPAHWEVPDATCSCGLYATAEPEHLPLAGITAAEVAVVGPVAMWGRVVEHQTGARAQKAYPTRLRLVCGACLALGRGAVDPVQVSVGSSSLLGRCAEHVQAGVDTMDAREVRSELLATYAVELLPLERIQDALRIPRPPGKGRLRSVLEAIATGILVIVHLAISAVALLWVAATIVGVLGIVFGIVTYVLGIDQPADAARSSAVMSPSDHVLVDYPKREPPMRVICGRGLGGEIEFAACAAGSDDVFGVAVQEQASGPFVDCRGDWVAYTAGDGHWICWHPVKGEHPDVQPSARAPDPFAG